MKIDALLLLTLWQMQCTSTTLNVKNTCCMLFHLHYKYCLFIKISFCLAPSDFFSFGTGPRNVGCHSHFVCPMLNPPDAAVLVVFIA